MIGQLDQRPRRRRRWALLAGLGCALVGGVAVAAAGAFEGDTQAPRADIQVSSVSCSESAGGGTLGMHPCVFVLTDGRRFGCPEALSRGRLQTPSALEHTKACARLTPLAIPAASQRVFAAIERVRSCLIDRGLRVVGGPSVGVPDTGPETPLGELIVPDALIGFYRSGEAARRFEPTALRTARRVGGVVARRGAVIVFWVRPPASSGTSSALGLCLDRLK